MMIQLKNVKIFELSMPPSNSQVTVSYQCKACQKPFKRQYDMQKHVAIYHKKYKCDDCNATFSLKYVLKCHVEKKHKKSLGHEDLTKIPCNFIQTHF